MKKVLMIFAFAIPVIGILLAIGYLNEKIDGIDEAVFQHMKDEMNSHVCMKEAK